MAKIITVCAGECRQATTGNITEEQLINFIKNKPLNKGPFFRHDRTELHTLRCDVCAGPLEITLVADGAEWLAYERAIQHDDE